MGSLGIQLAKNKGAVVIGVASQKNHAFMKDLGADYTIDYKEAIGDETKKNLPDGVDLIFDCASGESLTKSLTALKPEGTLVSILNQGNDLDPGINFKYVYVEPNSRQLEELAQLADSGKLQVPIGHQFSLDNAAQALAQIETHHTTGKIIIIP
ncbi:zinc-binding dehydrogenase [Adhaeribacter aquaticus]|uniref:zinc-binding dehydrogenase n=1 Tax=Adhaeribacter aquaticus TaxID=299567 RepID=UPI000407D153|nr:zinc-binding dehydrogenase [Adhaeribacter aquaticus]